MMNIFVLLSAIAGIAVAQECGDNEFKCESIGLCIPQNRVCDGIVDCFGGADELNCPSTTTTKCPGFQCTEGECIPADWKCDEWIDCEGGEDEKDCPALTTTTPCNGFVCKNGRCISDYWVCDGDTDCADGEDEVGCEGPCEEFLCDNGRCVIKTSVCNGRNDCGDWSDEKIEDCPCTPDQVRCPAPPEDSLAPGICIPEEFICDEDGIWDCPDGFDEANCSRPMIHEQTKYILRKSKGRKAIG